MQIDNFYTRALARTGMAAMPLDPADYSTRRYKAFELAQVEARNANRLRALLTEKHPDLTIRHIRGCEAETTDGRMWWLWQGQLEEVFEG